MFTGLIECVGVIKRIASRENYLVIRIEPDAPFKNVSDGESIAVSGPCLTVVMHDDRSFTVEASQETLKLTTLSRLRPGSKINLERALQADARLGGHFVTGHIDGILTIKQLRRVGQSLRAKVELPQPFVPYIVDKGSVALDGISLTVVEVGKVDFAVNLIPETQARTTWGNLKVGDAVNVEFDLIGKYIARFLETSRGSSELNLDAIRRMGY